MLAQILLVFYATLAVATCAVRGRAPANFTAVTRCLEHAIDAFRGNGSVVFFADELRRLPWADAVLRATPHAPKFVLEKRGDSTVYGLYVLFPPPQSGASYGRLFGDTIHSRSRFLLVWPRPATGERMRSLFDEFWRRRYVNVVAVAGDSTSTSFGFYTFDPYSEGRCGEVGPPYKIAEWPGRSLRRDRPWFPRRLRNLAGCPLIAVGTHQPPDNIMYHPSDDGSSWRARGVGSKILRIAEQYANFTSVVVGARLNASLEHLWYHFEGEMAAILAAVERREADLAFGWYSYANMETRGFAGAFELGRVSSIDCFGWAVPYRAGDKPPNVAYYVREFNAATWALVAVVQALCSALFGATSRRGLAASAMLAWQTLLERPLAGGSGHRHRESFKVLFAGFCFYSVVVSTAYKAAFGSFLSVPSQGREFDSVEDVLRSSLRVRGSPAMKRLVNASAGHTSMGAAVLRRYETLEPCDYAQIMTRLVRQRDLALLSVKRKLYYYALHEAKRIRVKIPFRFIPGCLVRPHTTHFLYKRGSHLIEPFNEVLNRLFEAGITTYWILHLGANRVLPLERLKGRALKVAFLREPLLLLLIGHGLATAVFVWEVFGRRIEGSVGRTRMARRGRRRCGGGADAKVAGHRP